MKKPTPRRLRNGMTVLLVPQTGVESMTLLVVCRVGSRYETKEINGASHFIEHLMFKGTTRRPTAQQISQELDRYGAAYNAYTDKDVTGYYIKMDASKTRLAVDLLHDMLFHSTFDKKEMDRERGVIVEEINMYEDNPQAHVDELLEDVLFPRSTLGWNIAGPREVIRTVAREQLVAYRDAYYTPERLTVVVAGKVIPGIWALLEKTFGRVRATAPGAPSFAPFQPPTVLDNVLGYQEKRTEQVQLAMAFYGPPIGHDRLPAAQLLGTILGGTMSSRLFTQIRERRGLCYSIHASHFPREDVGTFTISAGLDKKRLSEAIQAIYRELALLRTSAPKTEELRRAKDHVRGRTALAFEDSATQAEWYAKQWMFQQRLETPEERMKRFDRVTPAEIREVARQILTPERMASALIGPLGEKKQLQALLRWKVS